MIRVAIKSDFSEHVSRLDENCIAITVEVYYNFLISIISNRVASIEIDFVVGQLLRYTEVEKMIDLTVLFHSEALDSSQLKKKLWHHL